MEHVDTCMNRGPISLAICMGDICQETTLYIELSTIWSVHPPPVTHDFPTLRIWLTTQRVFIISLCYFLHIGDLDKHGGQIYIEYM